jgi:hypothetical protein
MPPFRGTARQQTMFVSLAMTVCMWTESDLRAGARFLTLAERRFVLLLRLLRRSRTKLLQSLLEHVLMMFLPLDRK